MLTAENANSDRKRWLKWAKLAFRIVVVLLVLGGITHTVRKSLVQFEQHRFSLWDLNPWWLTLAGVLYLVGSLSGWWFWHRVLWTMGQKPSKLSTMRAFFIGHLGKYVPGKAMVVILRAGLVKSLEVDTGVAAAAVFVETLTTMAVGAVLAAVLVLFNYHDQPSLVGIALLLMFGAGIPALPPVFRKVVRLLRVQKASAQIEPALDSLRAPLMLQGWAVIGVSWLALGLSLWATLAAMPNVSPVLYDLPTSLPLLTACVALAMVAGFASMLPGGVGVREFVVMTLLAPPFGEVAALVSAILLRFIWLVAELVASSILYFIRTPEANRTSNTEHRTPNTEHRTSNIEHRTSNTEHRMPNVERSTSGDE